MQFIPITISIDPTGQFCPIVQPPQPPAQVAKSQGAISSRPKLQSICKKTKMCRFHSRGLCSRGTACAFAHSEEELKPIPNLVRSKLCPAVLSDGVCNDPKCCFAHNKSEIQHVQLSEAKSQAAPEVTRQEEALRPAIPAMVGQVPMPCGRVAYPMMAAMPPAEIPELVHSVVAVDQKLESHGGFSRQSSTCYSSSGSIRSELYSSTGSGAGEKNPEAHSSERSARSGCSDGAASRSSNKRSPERTPEVPSSRAMRNQFHRTKICMFFQMGKCRKRVCNFAHSLDEVQALPDLSKTKMCPNLQECKDEQCTFAHTEEELRKLKEERTQLQALKRQESHQSAESQASDLSCEEAPLSDEDFAQKMRTMLSSKVSAEEIAGRKEHAGSASLDSTKTMESMGVRVRNTFLTIEQPPTPQAYPKAQTQPHSSNMTGELQRFSEGMSTPQKFSTSAGDDEEGTTPQSVRSGICMIATPTADDMPSFTTPKLQVPAQVHVERQLSPSPWRDERARMRLMSVEEEDVEGDSPQPEAVSRAAEQFSSDLSSFRIKNTFITIDEVDGSPSSAPPRPCTVPHAQQPSSLALLLDEGSEASTGSKSAGLISYSSEERTAGLEEPCGPQSPMKGKHSPPSMVEPCGPQSPLQAHAKPMPRTPLQPRLPSIGERENRFGVDGGSSPSGHEDDAVRQADELDDLDVPPSMSDRSAASAPLRGYETESPVGLPMRAVKSSVSLRSQYSVKNTFIDIEEVQSSCDGSPTPAIPRANSTTF